MKALKYFTFFSFGSLSLSVCVGCSTFTERIEKQLSENRVDAALSSVQSARLETPGDQEIIGLERRVRLRWLSTKLIDVRLNRLAENKGESIELMRKILKNENEWSLIPNGAVFATQAEETSFLSRYVQAGIYQALARHRPLEAESKYRRDKNLLEDLLKIETARVKTAIAREGSAFCESASRSLSDSDFYTSSFLKKSCGEFHSPLPNRRLVNSVQLFRELRPRMDIQNMPRERISDFSSGMKTEFERSLWYDAGASRVLDLTITGTVETDVQTQVAFRSKPYTVRIPYEITSIQSKAARTGLQTFFDVLSWALTTSLPRHEVDNGNGTITVFETRYREEIRHFDYQVNEVTQTLSVNWKITSAPHGQPHVFEFIDRIKTTSDEHSNRSDVADVHPEVRKVILPADWLRTLNGRLIDRIGEEFNVAWVEQFCGAGGSLMAANLAPELYHRCIYGANGRAPSFANEWFKQRYGIEIEAWRQLVAVHK